MDSTGLAAPAKTGGRPLGITTEIAGEKGQERRLERYEVQAVARVGLPTYRVAGCLRTVVHGAGGPSVWHEVEKARAKYGGLMVCGSVWVCPVCAAAIGERRREDLASALDQARALGYGVALVTFTFSHGRQDALKSSLDDLLSAYRDMVDLSGWKAVRMAIGHIGSIKAVEVTWGESNGWHPHIHLLMFYRADAIDLDEIEGRLADVWGQALASKGRHGGKGRMVKVQAADSDVAGYISKFGDEDAHRRWGVEDEMTKWHSKRAGKAKDGDQRFTPFDLLRWHRDTGERRPMRLFQEYAEAFFGRHQLRWTHGLRQRLATEAVLSDEAAAGWIDEDAVLLATLTAEEWNLVKYHDVRGELLEVAGAEGFKGLRSFLDSLLQI